MNDEVNSKEKISLENNSINNFPKTNYTPVHENDPSNDILAQYQYEEMLKHQLQQQQQQQHQQHQQPSSQLHYPPMNAPNQNFPDNHFHSAVPQQITGNSVPYVNNSSFPPQFNTYPQYNYPPNQFNVSSDYSSNLQHPFLPMQNFNNENNLQNNLNNLQSHFVTENNVRGYSSGLAPINNNLDNLNLNRESEEKISPSNIKNELEQINEIVQINAQKEKQLKNDKKNKTSKNEKNDKKNEKNEKQVEKSINVPKLNINNNTTKETPKKSPKSSKSPRNFFSRSPRKSRDESDQNIPSETQESDQNMNNNNNDHHHHDHPHLDKLLHKNDQENKEEKDNDIVNLDEVEEYFDADEADYASSFKVFNFYIYLFVLIFIFYFINF